MIQRADREIMIDKFYQYISNWGINVKTTMLLKRTSNNNTSDVFIIADIVGCGSGRLIVVYKTYFSIN